jgi:hypothetical protein
VDIANSLAPRSDQVNADDLVAGPMTVTIRKVVGGKAEQPFDFLLEETDRAYRPAVTMRRLIAAAWGTNGDEYVGRRLTIYRDPDVMFGKDKVGGIRISHMSHIDKRLEIKLQTTRGKRSLFVVEPLHMPTPPTESAIACATDKDQLREWWEQFPNLRGVIKARVDEIKAAEEPADGGAA